MKNSYDIAKDGCPKCGNRYGFAFGMCGTCGFNYLTGEYHFIEVYKGELNREDWYYLVDQHDKRMRRRKQIVENVSKKG